MDNYDSYESISARSASSSLNSPSILTPATSSNEAGTLLDQSSIARDHIFPLSDYLPIGCICGAQALDIERTSEWAEIHQIDLVADFDSDQSLIGNVGKLLAAQWIRVTAGAPSGHIILRIYVLPDDLGHVTIDRGSKTLRSAFSKLVPQLDVSRKTWKGHPKHRPFDRWATPVPHSLFWLYNTLPSPTPSETRIASRYSRLPVSQLLDDEPYIPGLKTRLFRYQARSVAAMIEREVAPRKILDPRFEPRMSPDGSEYFYSPKDMVFRKKPTCYEGSRGGILSETMGVGKTLMCLTLVMATRYHLPRTPPQHLRGPALRQKVGSLSQMAGASLGRHSVSAKAHFSWFHPDDDLIRPLKVIESEWPSYEIPIESRRSNRTTRSIPPPPRRLRLCSATIIVVPRNLIHQWEAEIKKHVYDGADGLKVLTLKDNTQQLPRASDLLEYHIILFSKSRFEKEHDDGLDSQGRTANFLGTECRCPYIGATRVRDCTCMKPEDIYHSPLKDLHFLRIIIDEGHEFSTKTSRAVVVATKLVTAERRWVVSGTPAKERLFGVDVELAAHAMTENYFPNATKNEDHSPSDMRGAALEQQSLFVSEEERSGAARPIGILLSNYLQVRPWVSSDGEDSLAWEDHFFRHEHVTNKTYSAFSLCMKATLEAIVIKTRPDDVEKDVVLPKLDHKVVYLDPCFYDTVTTNLFTTVLTGNAVASERQDADYLFHKNSVKPLHDLVVNLRRSSFFWTGFTEKEVLDVISHGLTYLIKKDTKCSKDDRILYNQCLGFAETLFNSIGWKALSATHEMGLFVDAWPNDAASSWALNGEIVPPMIGATHLRAAQRFVNERLSANDPTDGLVGRGLLELKAAVTTSEITKASAAVPDTKLGVPSSGLRGASGSSPKKTRPAVQDKASMNTALRKASIDVELDQNSSLALPSIIGTTSSKMSYMLGRIMALHTDEKTLIFYDSDNTAWYIAQCLELMHIKHLIYAKSLRPEQRSTYIVAFDTDVSIRVLLMDIDTGALGLNVNKASRVFFINPPCKPHQEAQAIKRAHRIGQDKPVFVETLILRGTLEEAMFKRSKSMTREEHTHADKELLNDKGIAQVIQAARILPIGGQDGLGWRQMAPLDTSLQIFGRKGRADMKITGIDADDEKAVNGTASKRKRKETSAGENKPKRSRKNATTAAMRDTDASSSVAGPINMEESASSLDTNMYNTEEWTSVG
ncbi:hypothetical protein EJ08DRAFT_629179 [Tothia fuscella]|uniref:Helicase C-terminal domain-containing protein n=1 Tax=Tothia fuscella TaxID=1048955 RepID=A0A9P4U0B3_9PEZI|nr:hypothetical protein EJ08DRAFT_629179 [Tothia fuscella]